MGGLDELHSVVHRPRSIDDLRHLFAKASESQGRRTFALIGGRQSFGGHFFPSDGGEGIDTTFLPREIVRLESEDGDRSGDPSALWVRASGNVTFDELAATFPEYLPRHPPTSDRVTLAGSLAACTHDSVDFFARYVRRFTLLTTDGRIHDCSDDAPGIAKELFRTVPGSFGTLGVVLDLELRLALAPTYRRVEITVAHEGRYQDGESLAWLDRSFAEGPPWGLGFYVFGLRGKTIILQARVVDTLDARALPDLPLTDDATKRNVFLQGLANRSPAIAHRIASYVLRGGRRFKATIYGHAFFQRSYARSYGILSSKTFAARALSMLGVDPRLPVVHQTFVVPNGKMRAVLEIYFEILERFPELVRRLELQDATRLSTCPWPLHPAHGFADGIVLFSTSMSVPRESQLEARAREFCRTAAARAFRELGVKILLLKQTHVDAETLYAMHADAIAHLARVKREVDPDHLLSSRAFEGLLKTFDATRKPSDLLSA